MHSIRVPRLTFATDHGHTPIHFSGPIPGPGQAAGVAASRNERRLSQAAADYAPQGSLSVTSAWRRSTSP